MMRLKDNFRLLIKIIGFNREMVLNQFLNKNPKKKTWDFYLKEIIVSIIESKL